MFLATAGKSFARDPLLNPLLEELERVPLAIELLAHASQTEPDLQGMWKSWQQKRTALLRRGEGTSRLSSVELNELSIGSRKMTPLALRLLGLLALLPGGLEREDLNALPEELDPFSAARTLREVGLAHDEGQRLRMLAPLREYVSRHHPPLASDLDAVIDHYVDMATRLGWRVGWEGGGEASRRLADELANLDSMIERALNRENPLRALEAATALAQFIQKSGLGSPRILAVAEKRPTEQGTCSARPTASRAWATSRWRAPSTRRPGSATTRPSALPAGGRPRRGQLHQEPGRHRPGALRPRGARARYEEALPLYRGSATCSARPTASGAWATSPLERSDHEAPAPATRRPCRSTGGSAPCSARPTASRPGRHRAGALRPRGGPRRATRRPSPLYRRVGAVLGEANCIGAWATSRWTRSDHDGARARYDEALPSIGGSATCSARPTASRAWATSRWRAPTTTEARKRYDEALKLYIRIAEPYSMGMTHRRLARMANSPAERLQHILAARAAWARIKRDDLLQAHRRVARSPDSVRCCSNGPMEPPASNHPAYAQSPRAARLPNEIGDDHPRTRWTPLLQWYPSPPSPVVSFSRSAGA